MAEPSATPTYPLSSSRSINVVYRQWQEWFALFRYNSCHVPISRSVIRNNGITATFASVLVYP